MKKLSRRALLKQIHDLNGRHEWALSEIENLRSNLADQVRKNDNLEIKLRQALCLATAGQHVRTRRLPTAAESAMHQIFLNIEAVTCEPPTGVEVGQNYVAEAPPCHQLPREKWCDSRGPGGFMGHTCYGKDVAR